MSRLAVEGGRPVRSRLLPYGRQDVDESDIAAVVDVLRSDWLTTGPAVTRFEERCAAAVGAAYGVAVNSGTAALHAAMHVLDVGPGDEVLVPALTFVATANCAVYQGATPVFVDVDPETLLVDPVCVEEAITPRTRAVIAVDYAGQPADYDRLGAVTARRDLPLVADACHALGALLDGRAAGSLAQLTCFSFHPVKHVTAGEGGMVMTDDAEQASRLRRFRNHGISTDSRTREAAGAFQYEMQTLGFNYRLTDIQSALGMSQLERLPAFIARRRAIASRYDAALAQVPGVMPLRTRPGVEHAYHLYVILLQLEELRVSRMEVYRALRAENIGVNVHYEPVYRHPYYRTRFGDAAGLCPVAEHAYERMLSLPMFPAMTDADVDHVVEAVSKVFSHYRV